ncbi:hypothetical protein D3C80_1761860 [compost metagenome]
MRHVHEVLHQAAHIGLKGVDHEIALPALVSVSRQPEHRLGLRVTCTGVYPDQAIKFLHGKMTLFVPILA